MRHDSDFAAYLAARWPALVRSLVLMGCGQQRAEEVVQQALARCYLAWGRVRESDDIDVQVYREVLDRLAHAAGPDALDQTAEADDPAGDDPGTVPTDAVLARRALEAALGRLDPEDRTVVVLHFVAGLSELQLSDLLDLPAHEVGDRLESATAGLDLPRVWEASR